MRQILKYTLEMMDSQIITIKSGEIISVENQNEKIVIYVKTDNSTNEFNTEFLIYGTGHELADDIDECDFLGTVKLSNGELMFHIFRRYL